MMPMILGWMQRVPPGSTSNVQFQTPVTMVCKTLRSWKFPMQGNVIGYRRSLHKEATNLLSLSFSDERECCPEKLYTSVALCCNI
eukprot:scaffold2498_cov195-Alexandrium_tamarense.AAC.18